MRAGIGLFCVAAVWFDGILTSKRFMSCGVVMMKMTSNTNTRSNNGVMFSFARVR